MVAQNVGYVSALIAKKLLSLGSDDDQRKVRNMLEVAPLDTDGQVFASENHRLHLGIQGELESNAELIMMARDYLAFTGNRVPFERTPDRLACIQKNDLTWISASPPSKYSNTICNDMTFSGTDVY